MHFLQNLRMNRYISYKRISKIITPDELDEIFKSLISDGYEIIYYDEKIHYIVLDMISTKHIEFAMIVGKLRSIG